MSVCPVCGCKTDELDFSEYKLGENTVKICSFCEKQLGNIETKEVGEPQLRWLDAVISKDVPDRSAEILQSLEDIRSRFFLNSDAPANDSMRQFNRQPQNQQPQKMNLQKTAVSQNGGMSQPARSNPQTNYDVASLEARIKKLEAELARMKKTQFIKTVLEIVIPIILFLIILIIFFSSGLFDSLKGMVTDFQSYMVKTFVPVFFYKGGF